MTLAAIGCRCARIRADTAEVAGQRLGARPARRPARSRDFEKHADLRLMVGPADGGQTAGQTRCNRASPPESTV